MNAFDHVVFDLDGTLVDSGADLAHAVNHVLAELGLAPRPLPTLIGFVGNGARRLMEQALGASDAQHLETALVRFLDYYGEHLLDRTIAYPGIGEMLAALRSAGATMSVLTNKPEAMSRVMLQGLGLGDFIDGVVGGDTLPTRKPDPAGLEQLRRVAGAAVERTLLVGDSRVDAETARAAGVPFCGVAWGLQPEGLRACRPRWLIEAPAALVPLVLGSAQ